MMLMSINRLADMAAAYTGYLTYREEAMGSVAKDVSVCRVKRGATLPDHFHIAEPGLEGGLHVLVAPLLDGRPFPPACVTQNHCL